MGLSTPLVDGPSANPDVELQALVKPGVNNGENTPAKKEKGLFQCFLQPFEEHTNVKLMLRVWQPRLEFFVRLMLVATFLDDTISTSMNFMEHAENAKNGCFQWVGTVTSPELASVIATVALCLGLLAQLLGSICVVALIQPGTATMLLIGWSIVHPVLYAQLSNSELVAASFSLVGGLLLLRAHVLPSVSANIQLLGRLLLPAVYLYYAGLFLISALEEEETSGFFTFVASFSMFVVYAIVFVGFVLGSTLVAAGLKSRFIAFVLAIGNLALIFYRHPFFLYIWYQDGEWKYDDEKMPAVSIALPTEFYPADLEDWQVYDLHKYYFFLGLSTSGALLLLTQFGPGKIAVQKDEVLLPYVARGQD